MLFKVDMTVNIPLGFPGAEIEEIKQRERPIRSSCSGRVNGDIFGASPGCTPTSVFLTCGMPKNCIRY